MKKIKIIFILILFSSTTLFSQKKGCISGDCKNGQGTFLKLNNLLKQPMSKYIGNWKNGEKNGEGTFIKYDHNGKEERKIVGNWTWDKTTDRPSGFGKEYKYGKLVYEGNFKNGIHHKTSGCIAGNCKNGFGVFIDKETRKYIGQWKDGKKNGYGLQLSLNKEIYFFTNYKNNKMIDMQLRVYNFKNELVQVIKIKDGKLEKMKDNKVKIGCLKGNCKNGYGIYKWQNGTIYRGEFKNEKEHGNGIVFWGKGNRFSGKFNMGNRHGYGTEYDEKGNIVKQGVYVNDVFQPKLSIEKKYSKNQKCIVGNCINGYGIYIETFTPGWNDAFRDYVNTFEIKYEGFWKDAKFNGIGYREDRMAQQYIGYFKDNNMQGMGTMIYKDRKEYTGEWVNNQRHGKGKEFDEDGNLIFNGNFYKDRITN